MYQDNRILIPCLERGLWRNNTFLKMIQGLKVLFWYSFLVFHFHTRQVVLCDQHDVGFAFILPVERHIISRSLRECFFCSSCTVDQSHWFYECRGYFRLPEIKHPVEHVVDERVVKIYLLVLVIVGCFFIEVNVVDECVTWGIEYGIFRLVVWGWWQERLSGEFVGKWILRL